MLAAWLVLLLAAGGWHRDDQPILALQPGASQLVSLPSGLYDGRIFGNANLVTYNLVTDNLVTAIW